MGCRMLMPYYGIVLSFWCHSSCHICYLFAKEAGYGLSDVDAISRHSVSVVAQLTHILPFINCAKETFFQILSKCSRQWFECLHIKREISETWDHQLTLNKISYNANSIFFSNMFVKLWIKAKVNGDKWRRRKNINIFAFNSNWIPPLISEVLFFGTPCDSYTSVAAAHVHNNTRGSSKTDYYMFCRKCCTTPHQL